MPSPPTSQRDKDNGTQPRLAFDPILKLKGKRGKGQVLVAHLNVRSLLGKKDEIDLLLRKFDVDILCISESHLHSGVLDDDVEIEGYHIRRNDRPDKGKKDGGGGVAIYFKQHIDLRYSLIH